MRGFDVPLARVRNPDITKTFTLRFRAAGRQAVDEGAVAVGVPAFLPVTGGEDRAQVRGVFGGSFGRRCFFVEGPRL